MTKTIAINQPTFLPWIGWFDLADQSDIFVILDDVQFSKQSWQQRNRIRTPKGLEYMTIPIKKKRGINQTILETDISNKIIGKKILKSITNNYKKSKFFNKYFDEFSLIVNNSMENGKLVFLNISLIMWFKKILNINKKFFLASEINVRGKRTEYISKICEFFSCDLYISPEGASNYLLKESGEFDKRNIKLKLQNYKHPQYSQLYKPFISHACILDLIFNEGDNSGDIMRSGREELIDLKSNYESYKK